MLRERYAEALKTLPLTRIRTLLRCQDEDVQLLAAELLQTAPGVSNLPLDEWLVFLKIENPIALPLICELVKKNVAPNRLNLAQCVALGKLRPAPVAELGLAWAKDKPLQKREDFEVILELARAESPDGTVIYQDNLRDIVQVYARTAYTTGTAAEREERARHLWGSGIALIPPDR